MPSSAWKKNVDRKSTRLNSSHLVISYAVFCLKKKNQATTPAPISAHHIVLGHVDNNKCSRNTPLVKGCDMTGGTSLTAAILLLFFFFNDTATTEIYTLSLHDALPIWDRSWSSRAPSMAPRSWRKSF